ncbi:MAG: cysteine synthase family protein [Planctomycetota bacterium]
MIGNTPVVEVKNLHNNPRVKIFAKLEGSNPSGSVKDRVALSLIEQAEASGALTHDKIILESTSGNTGIGLAMVGAAKGYQVVLTMSSAMSEERKKVVRAFGATLVETDPTKGTGGAIEAAHQMVAENPGKYWMANQHRSLDNPLAHYEQTADEILKQVPDVTHFVAGIGTFGTLRGAGGRLRESAGAKVIGVEPILGQSIQGLRNMNEPNPPQLYDESLLDEKLMAMADTAHSTTRLLAEKEGLLVGMSSGAAMHGALRVAQELDEGVIVVLFPDRGEKYLSTSLFDSPAENTASLDDISREFGDRVEDDSWAFAI